MKSPKKRNVTARRKAALKHKMRKSKLRNARLLKKKKNRRLTST